MQNYNQSEYQRLFPREQPSQEQIDQWGQINEQEGLKGDARKLYFDVIRDIIFEYVYINQIKVKTIKLYK